MADKKINSSLKAVADRMRAQGLTSAEIPWRWESSRRFLFGLFVTVIGPELGFNPASADNKEELQAAWKKWCEVCSEGFVVESSNLGKHLSAEGYCAKPNGAVKGEAGEFVL